MALEVAKLRVEVDSLLDANPWINPYRALVKHQSQSITIYREKFQK